MPSNGLFEIFTDPEGKKPLPIHLQFPTTRFGESSDIVLYAKNLSETYREELEPFSDDSRVTFVKYPKILMPLELFPFTIRFTADLSVKGPLESANWGFRVTM